MESLIIFLKDTLTGFAKLHSLARIVKIGPRHMVTFRQHSAYNISAFAVLSALMALSINFFSPSESVGLATGLISAVIALVLVGVVGFFVNMAAPEGTVFADFGEVDVTASGLTNKWASYFALNFVVIVLFFLALNGLVLLFTDGDLIAVTRLVRLGFSYEASVFLSVACVTIAATSVVFGLCKRSEKILDGLGRSFAIFLITNLVCGSLFYFINYKLYY
jgi:hypothetical protein